MSLLSVLRRPAAKALSVMMLLALAVPLAGAPADARAGGGFSSGSRGARSFSAPATTPTAPRYAQPFQRTETPSLGAPAAASRGFGFGGGLLAGLLGAGVASALFGGGFFGGIAALFGLGFKLLLVVGLIWLVMRVLRSRSGTPAMAGGPMASARGAAGPLPGGAPRGMPAQEPITIGPADYTAFETLLAGVQEAYSREDVAALSRTATPEMVRYFQADLVENRQRGQRNDVSRTRLLQGDLAEAWREGPVAYATVAMRFAAIDVMVDRAGGRIVSGDATTPVEAREIWTFRRDRNGPWVLSAIQQAG